MSVFEAAKRLWHIGNVDNTIRDANDNDVLTYNSATKLWEAQPAAGSGDPDQNLWETIACDTVNTTTADSTTDTLTIAGGAGINTDISGDTVTITATGGGGNAFTTIDCPTGTDPVAVGEQTLTLTAGAGMTITGTVGTDTVDFAWAADLGDLTDVTDGAVADGAILAYDADAPAGWETLAVGNDGDVLIADTASEQGLKWDTITSILGTGETGHIAYWLSDTTLTRDASIEVDGAGGISFGDGTNDPVIRVPTVYAANDLEIDLFEGSTVIIGQEISAITATINVDTVLRLDHSAASGDNCYMEMVCHNTSENAIRFLEDDSSTVNGIIEHRHDTGVNDEDIMTFTVGATEHVFFKESIAGSNFWAAMGEGVSNLYAPDNKTVQLFVGSTGAAGTGAISVQGNDADGTATLYLGGDLAGSYTDSYLQFTCSTEILQIECSTEIDFTIGGAAWGILTSASLEVQDNKVLTFGDDGDTELYWDGTDFNIALTDLQSIHFRTPSSTAWMSIFHDTGSPKGVDINISSGRLALTTSGDIQASYGTVGTPGDCRIQGANASPGTDQGGLMLLQTANGTDGGAFDILSGTGTTQNGGDITITTGDGASGFRGGHIDLITGQGAGATQGEVRVNGVIIGLSPLTVQSGDATGSAAAGIMTVKGGTANATFTAGGDVELWGGAQGAGSTEGSVYVGDSTNGSFTISTTNDLGVEGDLQVLGSIVVTGTGIDLASVLVEGNITGGTNLDITSGDLLSFLHASADCDISWDGTTLLVPTADLTVGLTATSNQIDIGVGGIGGQGAVGFVWQSGTVTLGCPTTGASIDCSTDFTVPQGSSVRFDGTGGSIAFIYYDGTDMEYGTNSAGSHLFRANGVQLGIAADVMTFYMTGDNPTIRWDQAQRLDIDIGASEIVSFTQTDFEAHGTTTFNNLTYTWPATQSGTQILQNNGSGTLTWVTGGAGGESLTQTLAIGNTSSTVDIIMSTDDEIQFRDSGQAIWSSAASTLNIDATTTAIFQIGGATEMTLTANVLTFENGASDTGFGFGVSGILDIRIGGTAECKFSANRWELAGGGVANPSWDWDVTDTLAFSIGGVKQFNLSDGVIAPETNNDIDLGTTSLAFKDVFIAGTTKLNGLTYTWPSTQSGTQILENNGSGTLSWAGGDLTTTLGRGNTSSGTAIVMSTTDKIEFRDSGQSISSSIATFLTIDAGAGILFSLGGATKITLSGSAVSYENGAVDTGMNFATSGQLKWTVGGVSQVLFTDGTFEPNTNNDIDLGASGKAFKDVYVAGTTELNGVTYTWPGADGSNLNCLTTNGGGTLSWAERVDLTTSQTLTNKDLTAETNKLRHSKSITVEDPADGDRLAIFMNERAITVLGVSHASLAGTSVLYNLEYATSIASGTVIHTDTCASATPEWDVTPSGDATIATDQIILLEITTVTGSVTDFHVTIYYDED